MTGLSFPGVEEAGGVAAFWTTSDGKRLRHAWFRRSRKPGDRVRGTIVLLHGRTEFIEKHVEMIHRFQAMGFDLWTFDWRGQGLSDRTLTNTQIGHIDVFDSYLEDLDGLIADVVLPAADGPLILVGHSMGGHLALRHLARLPGGRASAGGVYAGGILMSPMIGINTYWMPEALAPVVATLACAFGISTQYLFGAGDFGEVNRRFEGNPLTKDPERFAVEAWWFDKVPQMRVGAPSFGWVKAAFHSMHHGLSDADIKAIDIPLLMLLAAEETVTDNPEAERLAARLPDCELHVIANARHELYRETDGVQAELWARVEGFLGRCLGPAEARPAMEKKSVGQ